MNIFKKVEIIDIISVLLAGFASVAAATPEPVVVDANVEVVDKVGRSTSEYFYSPIVGFNYQDITSIDPNFIKDVNRFLQQFNINRDIPVDHTELGGIIGLLVDGQYQIISTSYWRAGFQTGLVYTSPVDSEFILAENNCPPRPGQMGPCTKSGTLETSGVSIPMLFTFSRYAEADRYITTLKLGPMITHQMYDLDFGDYQLATTHEDQVSFQIGLDGRYRLGQSDIFLLTGFVGGFDILGGNNGNFSGVNPTGSIGMYVGLSFS